RCWWEPTDDEDKTGFAGAYWPVTVMAAKAGGKYVVIYDNEETGQVREHTLSSIDLPVEFGKEEFPLQPGEFCEIHNGSDSDPCAWVGKVSKLLANGDYVVTYPFHDTGPERIKACNIRRARVLEAGMWRLIKPHQKWRDGEVVSPVELETIDDDWEELGKLVDLSAAGSVQHQVQAEATIELRSALPAQTAQGDSSKAGVPGAGNGASHAPSTLLGIDAAIAARSKRSRQADSPGKGDEEGSAGEEGISSARSESESEPDAGEKEADSDFSAELRVDEGSHKRLSDRGPPAKRGPASAAGALHRAKNGASPKARGPGRHPRPDNGVGKGRSAHMKSMRMGSNRH
ncbi:hypothetical protein QJQ45_025347, partial [Haematococcus lacustris]